MALFDTLRTVLTPYADKIKNLSSDISKLNNEGLIVHEELIQSIIASWLDNHPEATTTVQDGSITKTKLSSALKNIELASTYSDLLATTGDEIIVLNDNSYYGNNQTVRYMRYEHDWNSNVFGYQRADGSVVVPKPRYDTVFSNPPMISIGDVIGSYLNKSNLIYPPSSEEPKCAFDTICQDQIDCSTFVYLVMQGIDYDNSRYSGNVKNTKGRYSGNNIPLTEQSRSSNRKAFNSSEIALFFATRNRLFYINYDQEHPVSQLQAGDILFWSDYTNVRTYDRYLGIHHVAVVVETYPDSDAVMIAQAGSAGEYYTQPIGASNATNTCNLSLIKISEEGECLVYARPNYGIEEKHNPEQVIKYAYCTEGGTPDMAGHRTVLSEIYFKRPLNKNKMYTLTVRGDIPFYVEDSLILGVFTKGDYNLYNIQCKNLVSNNQINIPFVPRNDIDETTDFWLCVWWPNGKTVSTTDNYNVTDISIFEGLIPRADPICSDIKNGVEFNTDSQNGTVTIATTQDRNGRTMSLVRCWKEANTINVFAFLKLNERPNTNGFITIGQLNSSIIKFPPTPIERCYRVRGVSRVMRIDTDGSISAWVTTDDVAGTTLFIDVYI